MTPIRFKKLHAEAQVSQEPLSLILHAFLLTETGRPNNLVLPPRFTRVVPTGIIVATPPGRCLIICSRSGLARLSVFVANAPGILDPVADSELEVLLYNGGHESRYIKHGDRIAQLLLLPTQPIKGEEIR